MKYTSLLFLFLGISISGFSQNEELDKIISELKAQIITVDAEKKTYEQSLKNSGQGVITYTKEELTSKGDNTIYTYELNLADIDEYTIREETKGDIILVVFTIEGKQKLIKTYKDQELKAYEYEGKIVANDIDNARVLKEILKKSIPVAKKVMESRLQKREYQGWLEWIQNNVGDVDLGGKTYRQEIAAANYPGSIVFSQSTINAKTSKTEKYTFNLADINTNQVKFKVTGNEFGLEIETLRNQKLISVEKDNEVRPFKSNIEIIMPNVEQARDLKAALLAIVPQAIEQVENSLPELTGTEAALESMQKYIVDVNYDDDTYRQSIEPTCITTFVQSKKTPKGEDESTFEFNLIDVNPNLLDYSVSLKKMFLEVEIHDNTRLIKEQDNGVIKGYANKLRVYVPDAEVGRRLLVSMKKACEMCKRSFKNRYPESSDEMTKWLTTAIKDVTIDEKNFDQKLELLAGEEQKFKFNQKQYDDRKSVARVYEFGLADLAPSNVDYKISGRKISLIVGSKFKEKVIKFYKDNEVQNYVNSFEIIMPDIETARHTKSALIKIIEEHSN